VKKSAAIQELRPTRQIPFSKREAHRQIALKPTLFAGTACQPGTYRKGVKLLDICLPFACMTESLHSLIRREAIAYYKLRKINWHSLEHLLSSQSACVNAMFPFIRRADLLKNVLSTIGYPVQELLPFQLDAIAQLRADGWPLDGSNAAESTESAPHFIAFEWIGRKNYLHELFRGKVRDDRARSRGQGFTSADFAVRFRRIDNRVQVVLVEWKYTECYPNEKNKRFSGSPCDRLDRIYRRSLELRDSQIRLPGGITFEDLFFDPFDQMMRHQLLASAMEREHEMGADVVSLLHISPQANRELRNRITSPGLRGLGATIYEVWRQLVAADRFTSVNVEDLLRILVEHPPDPEWADDIIRRYGGMQ